MGTEITGSKIRGKEIMRRYAAAKDISSPFDRKRGITHKELETKGGIFSFTRYKDGIIEEHSHDTDGNLHVFSVNPQYGIAQEHIFTGMSYSAADSGLPAGDTADFSTTNGAENDSGGAVIPENADTSEIPDTPDRVETTQFSYGISYEPGRRSECKIPGTSTVIDYFEDGTAAVTDYSDGSIYTLDLNAGTAVHTLPDGTEKNFKFKIDPHLIKIDHLPDIIQKLETGIDPFKHEDEASAPADDDAGPNTVSDD